MLLNAIESLRSTFKSIDDRTKTDIKDWLITIKSIKNDTSLTNDDKERALSKVKTSEAVTNLIKSFLDALTEKAPEQSKNILKTGLAGASMAATLLSMRMGGVPQMLMNKALNKTVPKFILSDRFDELAALLEKELHNQAVEQTTAE